MLLYRLSCPAVRRTLIKCAANIAISAVAHSTRLIVAAMAELVELRDQGAEGSIHGLRIRGAHFWVRLRLRLLRALVG